MTKLFLLVLLVFALNSCTPQQQETLLTGSIMGTTWSLKLVHTSSDKVDVVALRQGAQARLDQVNQQMSTWIDDSDLSIFNRAGQGCVPIQQGTLRVAEAALALSNDSKGAFDVTVGPLIERWGFGRIPETEQLPQPAEIEVLLSVIGDEKISVQSQPSSVLCKTHPEVEVNFSAIAKGYGVDQLAHFASQQGFQHYLAEVGGELRAQGKNKSGHWWAVGVEKPDMLAPMGAVVEALPLQNMAIATSGDYRNFYWRKGQRYSHIINPKTGFPVTHETASVSVLAATSMMADGWATAFLVMGVKDAIPLANQKQLAVLMIERQLLDDGSERLHAHKSEAWIRYEQRHENNQQ